MECYFFVILGSQVLCQPTSALITQPSGNPNGNRYVEGRIHHSSQDILNSTIVVTLLHERDYCDNNRSIYVSISYPPRMKLSGTKGAFMTLLTSILISSLLQLLKDFHHYQLLHLVHPHPPPQPLQPHQV